MVALIILRYKAAIVLDLFAKIMIDESASDYVKKQITVYLTSTKRNITVIEFLLSISLHALVGSSTVWSYLHIV